MHIILDFLNFSKLQFQWFLDVLVGMARVSSCWCTFSTNMSTSIYFWKLLKDVVFPVCFPSCGVISQSLLSFLFKLQCNTCYIQLIGLKTVKNQDLEKCNCALRHLDPFTDKNNYFFGGWHIITG